MKKEAPENEASYLSHGLREAVFPFIILKAKCVPKKRAARRLEGQPVSRVQPLTLGRVERPNYKRTYSYFVSAKQRTVVNWYNERLLFQ